MSQRYYQPITSRSTNPTNQQRTSNYPNVMAQQQRSQFQSHAVEMSASQAPIYEGLDPMVLYTTAQNKTCTFNSLQYSTVTDIDPGFFAGNDYDNATAPAVKCSTSVSGFKPSFVNGNTPRISTTSSQGDRSFSFKSNNSFLQPTCSSTIAGVAQNNIPTFSMKFDTIRKSCFATKTLFTDPDFPPADASLSRTRKPQFPVVWMRPPDIVNLFNQNNGSSLRPEFIVNGYETCDLNQGGLGDCWVVAALAAITCHDFERTNFLSKVIPPGQSFRSGWYTGAFFFRFWRNGEWREVIVDDFLPTKDGHLVYISSITPNEFWGAIVEKAYAKLNGSYEALDAGQLADALDDFTGGMTEYFSLDYATSGIDKNVNVPTDFDDQLIKAFERHSLIAAGILNKEVAGSVKTSTGVTMPNGLVSGHAYTISDIRKIKLTDNHNQQYIVTLIRVRNPWGNEIEWRGPWSDHSPEWLSINDNDRKAVGLVKKSDGEFWISMKDFLLNFDTLDICHIPFSGIVRGMQMKHIWHCSAVFGEWQSGVSAGGRPKLMGSHFMNPHYRLELKESCDSGKCNVLIGLLQEDVRGGDPSISTRGNLSIGFVIYQLKPSNMQVPLNAAFFKTNSYIASVDSFINAREVVKRFQLPVGSYLIVPCTYDSNQDGKFLLRIFLESPNNCLQSSENIATLYPSEPKMESQKDVRQTLYRESGNETSFTAFQLQRLVNSLFKEKGFKYEVSVDATKAMVQLFEKGSVKTDSKYKLQEDQFGTLWTWLLRCLKQIQAAETVGPMALKSALEGLDLKVSQQVLQNLIHRFCNESGFVSVSSFLIIVAIISKANESFDDFQKNNLISQTREEYLFNVTKI